MTQKHILLAITGSIAAYKACELVRLLRKQGHQVTVALSRAASEFVTAQTFQALSGQPVLTEQGGVGNGMAHINATRSADIMLIAPASANTLAKIANGIADNLITEMALAHKGTLVLAPAMNVEMWQKPSNLRNIKQIQDDGAFILLPAEGEQACGEVGIGRMLEPVEIVDRLTDFWSPKPLQQKRVLISLGGTYEAIDPVRGITNISSGQMGVALARACRQAGAQVSVVYGNIMVPLPFGLAHTQQAVSALAMREAILAQLESGIDVFISVAAVADYRVETSQQKLKKAHLPDAPLLKLIENPDILQEVATLPHAPFCVGFAAESENVLVHARQKRRKKNIPMLVANQVGDAMGKPSNKIIILDEEKESIFPEMTKDEAAWQIVLRLAECLNAAQA